MFARTMRRAATGLAFFLGTSAAAAAVFSVNPVRITLSQAEPLAALTVRNHGNEPATVQLELTAWTQRGGTEEYTATRDLIGTPVIFTMPARGAQIVRLGLRGPRDPKRERTYRVFLREIPQTPVEGFRGLQVALRLGVPVFVPPATPTVKRVRFNVARTSDDTLTVQAINEGTVHTRIATVSLQSQGATLGTQQIANDVHAGQTRGWPIHVVAAPRVGSPLDLAILTEDGPLLERVAVQAP